MKCPNCGNPESKVVDSRPTENSSIRRRRECLECGKRFTTYEIIETVPVFVVKKDGSKEIFDRNKIITGMIKACYKRPVTLEQINAAVDEIENDLQNSLQSEYTSAEIGDFVMAKLKELDEVSYVRFASVYREFKDVETFMNELKELMRAQKKARRKSNKTEK
ncbi:MAG: transcriptional repressor NrdR [Clostridia bacterium]|nr:transcriptional repressor NrdR [Clostridia bacterium]